VKENEMGRACSTDGEKRNPYRIFVGKPEGKRHDIQIDLGEIGLDGMGWIHLAQDSDQWGALVKTVINFRVP
jgi:hypothetical protein